MQLVSNYPQVPLATSNPATDAARVEGQQRPPVIPPQQPTKGHEERAFNPQNERTADTAQQNARLATQVHERQQQSNQQQQQQNSQEQKQQGKSLFAAMLVKPALDRKDIRNAVNTPTAQAAQQQDKQQHPLPGQSDDFYRDLGSRIGDYYRQQTSPASAASLDAKA